MTNKEKQNYNKNYWKVIKYIESSAIRNHMKKDKQYLSAISAASIVNVTNRLAIDNYLGLSTKRKKPLTILEKHKIFKQILKDFPDEYLQEGKLHYYANDHIKEYMHNELKFISDFKKNPKKKYHYSFSIRFRDINGYDDCNDYNDLINNFDSFDACINEVKYKAKNYIFATKDYIIKIFKTISSRKSKSDLEYIAVLNEKYEFIDCISSMNGFEDCIDDFWMDNIHLMYKIPFKEGDLVVNKNKPNEVLVVYESKQFGYDFLISNGKWVEYFSSNYKSWVYLEYYDGIPKMSEEEIKSLKRKARRLATRLEKEYEELS